MQPTSPPKEANDYDLKGALSPKGDSGGVSWRDNTDVDEFPAARRLFTRAMEGVRRYRRLRPARFSRWIHEIQVRETRNSANATGATTSSGIESWPHALGPGNTPKRPACKL